MKKRLSYILLSAFLLPAQANQVLVTIGDSGRVTEQELEAAMLAAPFATQFPAMDEQDQAYLRGDMLLRLARAEALYQEAIASDIQQTPQFKQEIGNFSTTTLAQRYLYRLRRQITVPDDVDQLFKEEFSGNGDALTAARSAYLARRFSEAKQVALKSLREQANVRTHFERLNGQPSKDSLLAEGDALSIRYGDLFANNDREIELDAIEDEVNEWIDLMLMARTAQQQGENIAAQLAEYGHDLAIRLLLAQQEQNWIPDEQTLFDYFQRHPDIGYIPERRQIGQIVVATKQQAEQLRARIVAGESLFELAGSYSIDPYGRQRLGDMGWLSAGSAAPEIEQAIDGLPNDRVSEPIQTEKGWHLVMIVDRKPSVRKNFAAIKDRVRQKFVAEKMSEYLREVTKKYPLKWQIAERDE
ncbi:peptidylprolyl isomerase [Methylomarinum vadi]|uniref:peptidylprolyl isomerase n=1 Tax=Methylomarinum vadi TaxID=438855 RepID=UPI0004DF6FC3|nr:peptidylprolyl isomerase [Methylomarinum vadi]